MEKKIEDGGQRTEGGETALLPCPFCGHEGKMVSGMGESWVRCPACDATTKMMSREADSAVWWNKRCAERDEYALIIQRLKQRGLIPETFDAASLEVDRG